jgi:hypothetical protein
MIRRDFFKSLAATRLALFVSETLDPTGAEAAPLPSPAASNETVNTTAAGGGLVARTNELYSGHAIRRDGSA